MSWKPEIEEIARRRQRALEMGGKEKVARQHAQGKLSARERIAYLLDRDSFTELGMLATHQSQRPEMPRSSTEFQKEGSSQHDRR